MTFNIETRSGRVRSGTMTDRKPKAKKQPLRSVDPDFSELLALLDGKTAREISEGSGNLVGKSTIYKWRSKKANRTRRPVHYTMSAAASALGFEYCLRPKRLKK